MEDALGPHSVSRNRGNGWPDRLPNELIQQILESLTPLDIQVLKRTCSHLLLLCEDFSNRKFPNTGAEILAGGVYGRPDGVWWAPLSKPYELRDMLTRDRVCHDCAWLRADSARFAAALAELERPLWCDGCKAVHHSFLFSHSERDKSAMNRKCIGMEGHVRLCRHKVITWADVLQMKATSKQRAPLGEVCIECHDASHRALAPGPSHGALGYFPKALYHAKLRNTLLISSKMAVYSEDVDEGASADGLVGLVGEANQSALIYACPHTRDRIYRLAESLTSLNRASLVGSRRSKEFRSRNVEHMWSCRERRCQQYLKLDIVTTSGGPSGEGLPPLAPPGVVKRRRDVCLRSCNAISVESPTHPAWLGTLDPDSYLCVEDEMGKGIMWCNDAECPTMFRSLARSKLFSWRVAEAESVADYKPYMRLYKRVASDA